jgi:hypothetical protein
VTVQKYYVVKDRDTMEIIYQISDKLDTGNENTCLDMFLDDVIEYTVKIQEVLSKILKFEEQVRKKEQELTEMATKLSEILRILEQMGYVMVREGSIVRQLIKRDPNCIPY